MKKVKINGERGDGSEKSLTISSRVGSPSSVVISPRAGLPSPMGTKRPPEFMEGNMDDEGPRGSEQTIDDLNTKVNALAGVTANRVGKNARKISTLEKEKNTQQDNIQQLENNTVRAFHMTDNAYVDLKEKFQEGQMTIELMKMEAERTKAIMEKFALDNQNLQTIHQRQIEENRENQLHMERELAYLRGKVSKAMPDSDGENSRRNSVPPPPPPPPVYNTPGRHSEIGGRNSNPEFFNYGHEDANMCMPAHTDHGDGGYYDDDMMGGEGKGKGKPMQGRCIECLNPITRCICHRIICNNCGKTTEQCRCHFGEERCIKCNSTRNFCSCISPNFHRTTKDTRRCTTTGAEVFVFKRSRLETNGENVPLWQRWHRASEPWQWVQDAKPLAQCADATEFLRNLDLTLSAVADGKVVSVNKEQQVVHSVVQKLLTDNERDYVFAGKHMIRESPETYTLQNLSLRLSERSTRWGLRKDAYVQALEGYFRPAGASIWQGLIQLEFLYLKSGVRLPSTTQADVQESWIRIQRKMRITDDEELERLQLMAGGGEIPTPDQLFRLAHRRMRSKNPLSRDEDVENELRQVAGLPMKKRVEAAVTITDDQVEINGFDASKDQCFWCGKVGHTMAKCDILTREIRNGTTTRDQARKKGKEQWAKRKGVGGGKSSVRKVNAGGKGSGSKNRSPRFPGKSMKSYAAIENDIEGMQKDLREDEEWFEQQYALNDVELSNDNDTSAITAEEENELDDAVDSEAAVHYYEMEDATGTPSINYLDLGDYLCDDPYFDTSESEDGEGENLKARWSTETRKKIAALNRLNSENFSTKKDPLQAALLFFLRQIQLAQVGLDDIRGEKAGETWKSIIKMIELEFLYGTRISQGASVKQGTRRSLYREMKRLMDMMKRMPSWDRERLLYHIYVIRSWGRKKSEHSHAGKHADEKHFKKEQNCRSCA